MRYCLYYTTCAAKRQGKYHTKICKKYPSRTVRRRTDSKNRLLADLDAELELQVAENFLDEAVDLIGGQRLVSGLEGQAERHALLVRAELFGLRSDVEQLDLGQLLAGALHLGDEGAALHALGGDERQITLDRGKLGDGLVVDGGGTSAWNATQSISPR